jgi:hypothetical protein
MGGITTLRLNDIMMANHRKKINTRILENFQNDKDKKLKVQPTRNGKNFYVRYWMENKECQKRVSAMNTRKQCKIEEYSYENADEDQSVCTINYIANQSSVVLRHDLILRLFEKVYLNFLDHEAVVNLSLVRFQVLGNFGVFLELRTKFPVAGFDVNVFLDKVGKICQDKPKLVSDRVFSMLITQKENFL